MSTVKTPVKQKRAAKEATTITVRASQVMSLQEDRDILHGVARGRADIEAGRVKTTEQMKSSVGKWFR